MFFFYHYNRKKWQLWSVSCEKQSTINRWTVLMHHKYIASIKCEMMHASLKKMRLLSIMNNLITHAEIAKDHLASSVTLYRGPPRGYLFHCSPEINWLVPLFPKNRKFVFLSSLFPNIVFVPLFPWNKYPFSCYPKHLGGPLYRSLASLMRIRKRLFLDFIYIRKRMREVPIFMNSMGKAILISS